MTFFQRFWSKNGHFSNFLFQPIQARKMSFGIFQNEKTPFQAIKTRSSRSRKNQCCWSKNYHFSNFFFQAIYVRKMSFMIIQNQKKPFQAKKTTSSKSRKIDIFPKKLTHGFGPKMAIFPPFFYPIQARKMSFMIFQNEKTLFQAIKRKSSKSQKINIFPRG